MLQFRNYTCFCDEIQTDVVDGDDNFKQQFATDL